MKQLEERVMRTVEAAQAGTRLDRFVAQAFGRISRGQARRAIEAGYIWINGQQVQIMSRPVQQGDRVTWLQLPSMDAPTEGIDWRPFGGPPEVLMRDAYMAILNKASGTPIEPTAKEDLRTSQRRLEALLRAEGLMERRLYVTAAHRLDAGASGAVAFALRKQAAAGLSAQFAAHSPERIYQALVVGTLEQDEQTLSFPIGKVGPGIKRGVTSSKRGKPATTHVRVLKRFAEATLIEVRLETGRTHQIRVHMAHIGHPLLGDWLYCPKTAAARCPVAPRLMLHAASLRLQHPVLDHEVYVEAPLDPSFSAYLELL